MAAAGYAAPWYQQAGERERPRAAPSVTTAAVPVNPLWITVVVVSTLIGLGLVQVADARALHGANPFSSTYLFILGLVFIFTPSAARILMRKAARAERIALVILLGIAFYVVKIQSSPHGFLLNDEFIHLRNTQNILAGGHLFGYNPLLPTASYYPGLAAITATLADFTGLSVFVCGVIIIGVARVLICASLYVVAERVTGSARGAGVASLVYATNSMFLFWSAQFAYEDLGLPLAAFIVWWIGRTRDINSRVAAQLLTGTSIVAITVTHHISAFALCGILAVLYIAECIFRYPPAQRRYMGIFAALTGALAVFWFFAVAKPAASYLFGQNFAPALQDAISLINGHGGQRQLYGGAVSAAAAPNWYVYVGFAAILIIMGALLPAAIRAWRLLRARGFAKITTGRASVAVAAVIALTFPFTLLPRLTATGSAISGRTSEFIFIVIGCTLGLLIEDVARSTRIGLRSPDSLSSVGGIRTLVATLLLTLIFIGQISIGNSFFSLLPNKSVGFPLDLQPYMINVANWSRIHLGVHQTFATDATNELSLATDGQENPANVNVIYPVFFTARMDGTAVSLLKENDVHYVLLDFNATLEAPVKPGGSYYSVLEPDADLHGGPLLKAYYTKFSAYTCSRLVYKSGSIQIYDVSQISNGSCIPKLIKAPGKIATGKAATGKKTASTKVTS